MPFADDVRKYTFASFDHLVSKKGEVITEHPYIPTETQLDAMEHFVDCMDLSDAGEKDEEGCVPVLLHGVQPSSQLCFHIAIGCLGLILYCLTILLFTGPSKHCFTALWSRISPLILSHLLIRSC